MSESVQFAQRMQCRLFCLREEKMPTMKNFLAPITVLCIMLAAPAFAWVKECKEVDNCFVVMDVPSSSNKHILQVSLEDSADDYVLQIKAPLQVELRSGIIVRGAGGLRMQFPFLKCSADYCFAAIKMTREDLIAISDAGNLVAEFTIVDVFISGSGPLRGNVDWTSQVPSIFTFSLAGALDAMG